MEWILIALAVGICLLMSNKHEKELDKAAQEANAPKAISSGVKAMIWTVFTGIFAIVGALFLLAASLPPVGH